MTSAPRLAALCRALVERAGLTPVGECFHAFESAGVTGMVLLAESHLAVHTWPEIASVTLDAYVCNFGSENSQRAHTLIDALIDAFAPAQVERHALRRGTLGAPAGAATAA